MLIIVFSPNLQKCSTVSQERGFPPRRNSSRSQMSPSTAVRTQLMCSRALSTEFQSCTGKRSAFFSCRWLFAFAFLSALASSQSLQPFMQVVNIQVTAVLQDPEA